MSMKNTPAIIFFGWGPKYIALVTHCIRESQLPPYPIFLITDTATDIGGLPAGLEVVRHESQVSGAGRGSAAFLCSPGAKGGGLVLGRAPLRDRAWIARAWKRARERASPGA